MRRLTALVILLVGVFGLTGCATFEKWAADPGQDTIHHQPVLVRESPADLESLPHEPLPVEPLVVADSR